LPQPGSSPARSPVYRPPARRRPTTSRHRRHRWRPSPRRSSLRWTATERPARQAAGRDGSGATAGGVRPATSADQPLPLITTTGLDVHTMKRNHLAVIVAGLMSAATIGAGAASADDYTTLLIDPNFVFDTVQYSGGAPTPAPGGQPGAARVFTHNDGRFITDTVWVLPDAAAATAAAAAAQSTAGIANPKTEPVQVGTGVGRRLAVAGPVDLHPGQCRFGHLVHRSGQRPPGRHAGHRPRSGAGCADHEPDGWLALSSPVRRRASAPQSHAICTAAAITSC